MPHRYSKIHPCHGTSVLPSALVKAPLHEVMVLPAALAVFLRVLELQALCHQSEVQALGIDGPAEYPAPALSSDVGANVTAVLNYLPVKMKTSCSVVATSLMTKRWTTFSFMVPLPPLILKQQDNHNG